MTKENMKDHAEQVALEESMTVKCKFCEEMIPIEDINECDICNGKVCDLCAEESLHQVRIAPDDFTNVCIECMDEKYDGGR